MLDDELLQILNQIPGAIEKAFTAFIERHPGHANQKTHGNRFGAGQAKESLRRLKDDKQAREKYKESARGRGQGSGSATGSKPKPVEVDKRDLSTRTKQQRKQDIEHLSKLPLKEIRRRQDLVKAQQESAYNQWKNSNDPVTRERMERASSNLAQMDDDLMAAAGKWLDRDDKRRKIK